MIVRNLMLAAAAALLVFTAGCDTSKGPAEKAGAKVDNAVEKAGDKIEDAGDKIEDKTDR